MDGEAVTGMRDAEDGVMATLDVVRRDIEDGVFTVVVGMRDADAGV